MKTLVDIIIIFLLAVGIIYGAKRGLLKSLISFVGIILITVLSFSLKTPIANFMIDNLPFFELDGMSSLSILIYNSIAFFAVFLVLFGILKIILFVTKIVDTILKLTVIWIIPSTIGGAIIGFLESWILIHFVLFIMTQFSVTFDYIKDSKLANTILDKTPVVTKYFKDTRNASEEIYETIDKMSKENKDNKEINLYILDLEIEHNLVTKEKAEELIEKGKIKIDDKDVGKELFEWLKF